MRVAHRVLASLAVVALAGACAPKGPTPDDMVAAANAVDGAFLAGFNAGDVNALMATYWNSPELVSIGLDGMGGTGWDGAKAGWEATLAAMPGAQLGVSHDVQHRGGRRRARLGHLDDDHPERRRHLDRPAGTLLRREGPAGRAVGVHHGPRLGPPPAGAGPGRPPPPRDPCRRSSRCTAPTGRRVPHLVAFHMISAHQGAARRGDRHQGCATLATISAITVAKSILLIDHTALARCLLEPASSTTSSGRRSSSRRWPSSSGSSEELHPAGLKHGRCGRRSSASWSPLPTALSWWSTCGCHCSVDWSTRWPQDGAHGRGDRVKALLWTAHPPRLRAAPKVRAS